MISHFPFLSVFLHLYLKKFFCPSNFLERVNFLLILRFLNLFLEPNFLNSNPHWILQDIQFRSGHKSFIINNLFYSNFPIINYQNIIFMNARQVTLRIITSKIYQPTVVFQGKLGLVIIPLKLISTKSDQLFFLLVIYFLINYFKEIKLFNLFILIRICL